MNTFDQIANLIDHGYSVADALRKVNGNQEIGSPGYESKYTTINGTSYEVGLRINDFSSKPAQLMIHRHSTTLPAVVIGSRTKSDTALHADVTNNDILMSIAAAGYSTDSYYLSSRINFRVGTGTVSNTSMPGVIEFRVSANGSVSPSISLIVKPTTINLPNVPISSAGLSAGDVWSNAGVLTIV